MLQAPQQQSDVATASDFTSDSEEEDDIEEQSVYVISKGDVVFRCYMCAEPMRLQFLQDIEEWVYMDCVEHEGVPVHKLCRDCFLP